MAVANQPGQVFLLEEIGLILLYRLKRRIGKDFVQRRRLLDPDRGDTLVAHGRQAGQFPGTTDRMILDITLDLPDRFREASVRLAPVRMKLLLADIPALGDKCKNLDHTLTPPIRIFRQTPELISKHLAFTAPDRA